MHTFPTTTSLLPLIRTAALAVVMGAASQVALAQSMVSTARESVHMRAGAGTRHEVLWTLSEGYPLKVLGQRGGWLHVSDFEGDSGWVLGRLTGHSAHVIVKSSVANLRGKPGVRATIVAKASYGEVLRTLAKQGDWIRVRHPDGPVGWVAKRLVWGW